MFIFFLCLGGAIGLCDVIKGGGCSDFEGNFGDPEGVSLGDGVGVTLGDPEGVTLGDPDMLLRGRDITLGGGVGFFF